MEITPESIIEILRTPPKRRNYRQELHLKYYCAIAGWNATVGQSAFLVDRDGSAWRWNADSGTHEAVAYETSADGYLITPYRKADGTRGIVGAHQLVAIAYLDYFKPGFRPGIRCGEMRVVDHRNGNRRDNRLINLRVCTQTENLRNLPWNRK